MTTDDRERSVFEAEKWDLMGRTGSFKVNGRKVRTPELMPVVNPHKLEIGGSVQPTEIMEDFGFGMIITNSYIINRSQELKEKALKEGLHRMLSFDGVIMTDSGTFQSYMYGGGSNEVDVDPLEIIELQMGLGSDVGTILDRFTVPDSTREEAESDLEITMERAVRSLAVEGPMEVAVPVQGGRYGDLRELSGRKVAGIGTGYAPIGGVVPIMESYDYSLLVDVIVNSKEGLGPSIPVHLFGAGHPMILPLATALGCDLFDSASYIKFARDGRYMTKHRTFHLKEMSVLPCSCPVCCRKDPADLLSMPDQDRTNLLARHNLWVLREVIDEIRASIEEGTLWELIERTAAYNPSMNAAVRRVRNYRDRLEEYAPRSTRRFMCGSGLSLNRPEVLRYDREVIGRSDWSGKRRLILTDWQRSHNRNVSDVMSRVPHDWLALIRTPIGPVPYELIDNYPLGQSIFPPEDGLDMELSSRMEETMSSMGKGDDTYWDGKGDPEIKGTKATGYQSDLGKVLHMIRYQFGGEEPARVLFGPFENPEELYERVFLRRSRNTGRIRNILVEEDGERKHLLSIRAEDGMMTMKIGGAMRLVEGTCSPWRRVIVDSETGEFNARGLNVFCKFVKDADPGIRPTDDVLVVDEEDKLLAVGKAMASRRYLMSSSSGIAVKVRQGIDSGSDKDNN